MVIRIVSQEPVKKTEPVQSQPVNQQPEQKQEKAVTNHVKQQENGPIFMEAGDVATVDVEDAKKIGEFLNNKKLRKLREAELTNYLLKQTNDNGMRIYTVDQAEKLAKYQVKNEVDQARSKITIPFIDEAAYEKFKEQLKAEGKEDLYEVKLIKNKKVLAMINGDKITDPAAKEENAKKYFMTDENGNLIKGENGQYIFDPDKYKAEMVKDTSGYRLTLAGRAEHAERRGISKNAEKDAVKAAGLGYRKDRTWLYRSLLIGAGVASVVFGGAVATAIAGASSTAGAVAGGASAGAEAGAAAKATATNRVGQIVGGAACLVAAAFVKDRDGKDHRGAAQEVFENREETVVVPPPVVPEEEPGLEEQPVVPSQQEETCEEPPCMTPKELPPELATVSTIVGGGPYHYAQLYVDENGKPYKKGTPEFKELQRKLSSGEYSIQTVDRKHRELRKYIPVGDGMASLADDADAKAKRGFDDARVEPGTGDRKYAKVQRNGKWVVVYCDNGQVVPGTGKHNSREAAQAEIDRIITPAE